MLFQDKHQGVVVPMITPFTRNGEVDLEAAETIVNRFIASGVGVFVLGTTGETASIPRQDRLKLVESVVRVAIDRIPVYAGIGDNCLENSVEAARHYLEIGVDAVVTHLPSYYPLDKREMLAYFRLLHNRLNGPIMIYNIPQTTSMSLPMDLVEDLSELPHFVGFKDSERNEERLLEASRRFRGRLDFALFMGSAALSVEALREGFQGLVPGSGNLVPDLWARLFQLAREGNWKEAESLQQQLDEIAGVFQGGRTLGQSLAALKALMHDAGLCEPFVLPPLLVMEEREHVPLVELMNSSNLMEWPRVS